MPGHWEGDLILGKCCTYPDGYTAEQVRDALSAKIQTLPQQLRASLTWDQGAEMRD